MKMNNKFIGYFFIMKDGKPEKYIWSKGEPEEYRIICEKIWGGLPHDVLWAKNTNLYISAMNENSTTIL
jgi:hypothetical protein